MFFIINVELICSSVMNLAILITKTKANFREANSTCVDINVGFFMCCIWLISWHRVKTIIDDMIMSVNPLANSTNSKEMFFIISCFLILWRGCIFWSIISTWWNFCVIIVSRRRSRRWNYVSSISICGNV